MLDRDVPNVELEVGQAVSVGLDYLKIGSGEPYLREISIVPRGAVEGAEVTRRVALEPVPVKPTSSPAAVLTFNRAAVGDDFDSYRPPIYDELERKLGYRVDHHNFQQANTEASRTPLQKHHDEFVAAKRATEPQVITRYGIGKVLAVGVPVDDDLELAGRQGFHRGRTVGPLAASSRQWRCRFPRGRMANTSQEAEVPAEASTGAPSPIALSALTAGFGAYEAQCPGVGDGEEGESDYSRSEQEECPVEPDDQPGASGHDE
jgi:hypothetical protein